METKQLLAKIGLKHPEDKIYLYLLKTPRATVADIARHTNLYRPRVYKSLPELIAKNLVVKVRFGKRTMYTAEDPKTLAALIDELKEELHNNLPELNRLYESNQKKPVIRFFEGKEGIRHIYDTMIRASKKGDATYRYESPRDYKAIGSYYPNSYRRRATGPNGEIEKYVITNQDTQERRRLRLNRHSKAVPASYDSFDYNITQLIYKNKVAFIDFDSETATLIENQRFADFQLKLFKLLFGKL